LHRVLIRARQNAMAIVSGRRELDPRGGPRPPHQFGRAIYEASGPSARKSGRERHQTQVVGLVRPVECGFAHECAVGYARCRSELQANKWGFMTRICVFMTFFTTQ
jgi:hypothetical protein